jgi:hypothetical protein
VEGTRGTMTAQRILRLAIAVTLAIGLGASMVGCVPQGDPTGGPTGSTTRPPTKSPTPTPTMAPVLIPAGTAEQNLPFFDSVNQATWTANGFVEGRPYIDNLVASGFNRADMELTWWDTPDGHLADSIFFSVRFAGECLMGQIASWGYEGKVVPILASGSCMIGDYLQPIDW